MEYAEGGNIKNYIKIHKILNKKIEGVKLDKIFYESNSVLVYLRKEGFIHKNVSTSNIFLTKDGDVKVGGLEYLFHKYCYDTKALIPEDNITFLINNEMDKDDFFSLGLVFSNLRYLNPNHIFIPARNFTDKKIFSMENIKRENNKENNNQKMKALPENYMLYDQLDKERDKIIEDNYYKNYEKIINSSIESVYKCLIYLFEFNDNSFEQSFNRKINLSEFTSNGPISQSLKINDIIKLREILMKNNKSFASIREIPSFELIKFILKQLHNENNISKNNDLKLNNSIYNKNNSSKIEKYFEYDKIWTMLFKSIISNESKGFFGFYEIENYCKECKETYYYFEYFYYIALDFDSIDKNVDINTILEDYKDFIKTFKFCQKCKRVTEQNETKSIFKFPYRLVILIKNNSKKKLRCLQIFSDHFVLATINYNKNEEEYKYMFYQFEKMKLNNKNNFINENDVVAMFCIYVGDIQ